MPAPLFMAHTSYSLWPTDCDRGDSGMLEVNSKHLTWCQYLGSKGWLNSEKKLKNCKTPSFREHLIFSANTHPFLRQTHYILNGQLIVTGVILACWGRKEVKSKKGFWLEIRLLFPDLLRQSVKPFCISIKNLISHFSFCVIAAHMHELVAFLIS